MRNPPRFQLAGDGLRAAGVSPKRIDVAPNVFSTDDNRTDAVTRDIDDDDDDGDNRGREFDETKKKNALKKNHDENAR